jgi:hypothetical protein
MFRTTSMVSDHLDADDDEGEQEERHRPSAGEEGSQEPEDEH